MKRRDLLACCCGTAATMMIGNAFLWRQLESTASAVGGLKNLAACGPGDIEMPDFALPAFTDSESPLWLPPPKDFVRRASGLASSPVHQHPPSSPVAQAQVPAVEDAKSGDGAVASVVDESDGKQGHSIRLAKVRNFDEVFDDDIFLEEERIVLLHSVLLRLKKVQRMVGHGNFNLISFDETLRTANRFSEVGEFTRAELDFMEDVFFADVKAYGFYGEKVTSELTAVFDSKDAVKIPHSGHFLYADVSLSYYEQLRRDVGESIILTSGIRSNVKQMVLFLAKTVESNYNLSKASRSLAPPGHSYHGIGDFDVGRVGFGLGNFSARFAQTDEFKRMQKLGYVQIRYTADNHFGVRFEPWHIKVV